MTERPIFIPAPYVTGLVKEIMCQIVWNPGFARVQKEKNIGALHDAAEARGYSPILEISTKSSDKLGQHLSAFHLKVKSNYYGEISMESAFQGSKIFEGGGPYTELYSLEARSAKRDSRLRESGALVGFKFDDTQFPLEPKTAFYDWLYINAIFPHREWLSRLNRYAGYTDIEFNPQRSINCQARSCALFVALMTMNLLARAVESPESFLNILMDHSYRPSHNQAQTHANILS
jgi:hypothetical protein